MVDGQAYRFTAQRTTRQRARQTSPSKDKRHAANNTRIGKAARGDAVQLVLFFLVGVCVCARQVQMDCFVRLLESERSILVALDEINDAGEATAAAGTRTNERTKKKAVSQSTTVDSTRTVASNRLSPPTVAGHTVFINTHTHTERDRDRHRYGIEEKRATQRNATQQDDDNDD